MVFWDGIHGYLYCLGMIWQNLGCIVFFVAYIDILVKISTQKYDK